jgi:hypothetical protein
MNRGEGDTQYLDLHLPFSLKGNNQYTWDKKTQENGGNRRQNVLSDLMRL